MGNHLKQHVSDNKKIAKIFKLNLENLIKNICAKKKWKLGEICNHITDEYIIRLKSNQHKPGTRKLKLLPTEQRCIAVLENDDKKIQCSRKKKFDNFCGLHCNKELKYGTINDYNSNFIDERVATEEIKIQLDKPKGILLENKYSAYNEILEFNNEYNEYDISDSVLQEEQIDMINQSNTFWDTIVLNSTEYLLNTNNNILYLYDTPNLIEIGNYNGGSKMF
jgi:hypothetical protein